MNDVPETIDGLIDALGGVAAVAQRHGVSHSHVGNWRREGRIPARRYLVFKSHAAEAGVPLRDDLFSFDEGRAA